MSWEYEQSSGNLTRSGKFVANGYSGAGAGWNDPSREHESFVGTIPKGRYRMRVIPHTKYKPPVLSLTPEGHNARGRTLLLIHGDNQYLNNTASEGCIILPRTAREQIANGGDDLLEVK